MNIEAIYADAVAYVREHGDASCAALQRNLNIGYSTALQLRERMEQDGVIPVVRAGGQDQLARETRKNITRDTFQTLFESDLKLLRNECCSGCDPEFRNPLLPWIVGSRFSDTKERVVFVGKPHRGTPGAILPSGIIDPTDEVEEGLWDSSWPYWRYTREIAERLYGKDAMQHIAFSNIIKCTNSLGADNTTWTMAQKCLVDLKVIWRELEALQPRTVIFYTYSLFPELLEEVPVALPGTLEEAHPVDHRVPCGNKDLGWWERSCATAWTDKLRLLVVGHPERKKREDYVSLLANWIRPGAATGDQPS